MSPLKRGPLAEDTIDDPDEGQFPGANLSDRVVDE
jgi:hypothetical protein